MKAKSQRQEGIGHVKAKASNLIYLESKACEGVLRDVKGGKEAWGQPSNKHHQSLKLFLSSPIS